MELCDMKRRRHRRRNKEHSSGTRDRWGYQRQLKIVQKVVNSTANLRIDEIDSPVIAVALILLGQRSQRRESGAGGGCGLIGCRQVNQHATDSLSCHRTNTLLRIKEKAY